MHSILTCILFLMMASVACGQVDPHIAENRYREIFGSHYIRAENYLAGQEWMNTVLISQGISPAFAKSIVFPELIRYSAIQDFLEVSGLLTLYVQYGQKYSNFSVGRFQMKPSFAERIEKDVAAYPEIAGEMFHKIDTAGTPSARLQRVNRLNSPEWQCQYLVWFIRIMDLQYGAYFEHDKPEKLKFYAAAYNCGYQNPRGIIIDHLKKRYFHTALFSSDVRYNYSDIAASYYFLFL